jgi:uncharacterized membrane protein YphA (DoxX/SURF4 family)
MVNELKKTYFTLLVPAIIGLIVISFAKKANFISFGQIDFLGVIAIVTFILSVIFAIGLPIFYRSLFAHKMRDRTSVSPDELVHFERSLIFISLITPYLTLIGFLFEFPRFFLAGTVLMALYAVYYFYPSERRIQFEKRIFRVK